MRGDLINDAAGQIREIVAALNNRTLSYEEAQRLLVRTAESIISLAKSS